MLTAGYRGAIALLFGALSAKGGSLPIYGDSPGVNFGPSISVPADYSFTSLFTFDSSAPLPSVDQLASALSGASQSSFLLSGNSANSPVLQLLTLGTSLGHGGLDLEPNSLQTSSSQFVVANSVSQVVPEPRTRFLGLVGLLLLAGFRKALSGSAPGWGNTS